MQIDLRTVSIEPLRQTFDHLARRFGDKPASRYQEGSYDLQAAEHFHYRPTWAPGQKLYDPDLSRIKMADWQALKDPRQFYYSTYTLTRARQQEAVEADFRFVESRGLADSLNDAVRNAALTLLVPLRHAAYGANQNNTFVCGYGYGVPLTQPCMYHAMDNLGIAQYLSRIGLLLGGTDALDAAKAAWIDSPAWQPLRRLVEDSMVVRDPFELFYLQNALIDGVLYPLVYQRILDDGLAVEGGAIVAMLTQFMSDWFDETRKWVDAVLKVAAAESPENRAVLLEWQAKWSPRVSEALIPVAGLVVGDTAPSLLADVQSALNTRLVKSGIPA